MLRANDLPADVRRAVCNGGGPAAGLGALLVPDLIAQWVAAFNDHDAAYEAGGTWIDRLLADWRMVRDQLAGAGDWLMPDRNARLVQAAARGGARGWAAWLVFAAWSAAKLVCAVVLSVLALLLYYVVVRLGGGLRWLGSWKYRSAPASAAQVIEETRARLAYERKRGQGVGK